MADAAERPPSGVHARSGQFPAGQKLYDLRHAGVSWRLNAGALAPQVAEWAGSSVEMPYRIYAHCIDGDDERWHKQMEDFLG